MDLLFLKLSLEKLNDELEKLKERNTNLESRVETLESELKTKNNPDIRLKKSGFDDELLDTKQVRKYLGISHNTLQAIVNAGKLIQKRINGHSVRYLKSNVLAYVGSLE
jgi:predicted DNA-binding transcriptional regulator AlpA